MQGVSHFLWFEGHRWLARFRLFGRIWNAAGAGEKNRGSQHRIAESYDSSTAFHERGY
jgi:hypothetical protein